MRKKTSPPTNHESNFQHPVPTHSSSLDKLSNVREREESNRKERVSKALYQFSKGFSKTSQPDVETLRYYVNNLWTYDEESLYEAFGRITKDPQHNVFWPALGVFLNIVEDVRREKAEIEKNKLLNLTSSKEVCPLCHNLGVAPVFIPGEPDPVSFQCLCVMGERFYPSLPKLPKNSTVNRDAISFYSGEPI